MEVLLRANAAWIGLTLAAAVGLLALLHLTERAAGGYLSHKLGWRSVLLTGWIGVPIHELGHLVAAHLFGHRIVAWKLFDPDPTTGTLGYVRHAYSKPSAWQVLGGFFIGIAPLVSGGAALLALASWMLPAGALSQLFYDARLTASHGGLPTADDLIHAGWGLATTTVDFAGAVWRGRSEWLPLQLYLAVCIVSHTAPSTTDLSTSIPGTLLALVLVATGCLLASVAGISLTGAIGLVGPLALLTLAALVFQGMYVAVVAVLSRVTART